VLELTRDTLDALGRDEPALAAALWRAMAGDLADRLRRVPQG
jgi:hypothetical protein